MWNVRCLTQPQKNWRHLSQCSSGSMLWFRPSDSSPMESGVNVIPAQDFRLRHELLIRGRAIKHLHDFSRKHWGAAQHLHALHEWRSITISWQPPPLSPCMEVFLLHPLLFPKSDGALNDPHKEENSRVLLYKRLALTFCWNEREPDKRAENQWSMNQLPCCFSKII